MKTILQLLLLMFALTAMAQPLPKVSSGIIQRHHVSSKYVEARNVDVWLPQSYSPKKKHAVLYMHDGQMLFDSTTTWNRSAWDVDDALGRLLAQERIREVIVVGVWNNGAKRHIEYFPQKPFERLSKSLQDSLFAANRSNGASVFSQPQIISDRYLKFLVDELKPYIDSSYATLRDRDNTFTAGSSMGGLISLYAICEYPKVFGGAACLSTHWPGVFHVENNPIPAKFIEYLSEHLPDPRTHRLYFDYGDQTLDALYPPLQGKVDRLMAQRKFSSKNWMTMYFPGDDHSEAAWRRRFSIPMEFLLKN